MKPMLAILTTVVLAGGCKGNKERAPHRPRVVTVGVLDVAPLRGPKIRGIDRETVASRVQKALAGATWVRIEGAAPKLQLQLAFGLRETDEGKEEFVAIAGLRAPSGARTSALEASTAAPLRKKGQPVAKPSEELRKRHVWRTLDHTVASWLFQAKMRVASREAIIAALGERQQERVLAALDRCAALRMREAVPTIIGLLRHQDPTISERSIGVLVSIGDRRAVKPLTKLASFRESGKLAMVLDGIASLGGPEAVSFLEFVADGHRHPTVRDMARQALARLKRAKTAK